MANQPISAQRAARSRVTWWTEKSLMAMAGVSATACDDATTISTPNTAGLAAEASATSAVVVGVTVDGPEGVGGYLVASDALPTTLDLSKSVEAGWGTVFANDEAVFAFNSEEQTLQRFEVRADYGIIPVGKLSLVNHGIAWMDTLLFFSPTKAYYVDTLGGQIL